MASGLASRVKPVTKQTFGRASPGAAGEAADETLPNGALVYLCSAATNQHGDDALWRDFDQG